MPECLNCGAGFARHIGGRRQKYCSERCRRAFAKDVLAYAERMVAAGLLTLDQLREGTESNAALLQRPQVVFPGPEVPAEEGAPLSPSLALPPAPP